MLELKTVMFQTHGTHLPGLAPSLSLYRSSKSLAQTLCRQSAASAVWTVAPGFGTTANTGRRCLLTLCKQQKQQRKGLLSMRHRKVFFCSVYNSSQTDKNRYAIVLQSCRRGGYIKATLNAKLTWFISTNSVMFLKTWSNLHLEIYLLLCCNRNTVTQICIYCIDY